MVLYNDFMGREKKVEKSGVTQQAPNQTPALDVQKLQKEYLSILLYQAKQRDNLLGQFSADGSYKISDEKILNVLAKLPKLFGEKTDNSIYASTKFSKVNVVLNFKVELDIQPSFCKAKLFLIEIEHGIEEDKKHLTQLGEIEDIYSPDFADKACLQWNILKEVTVFEKNEVEDYLYNQNEERLFAKELTEVLSQLYLVRLLKLLEGSGEIGQKVSAEYRALVEKFIQKDPSLAQDNTFLKRVLDYVIVKNKVLPELLKNPEIATVFAGYSTPLANIRDKTFAPPVVEISKETKREEKKEVKSISKPAKKKSKGGGEKKADKGKSKGGGGGKKSDKGKSKGGGGRSGGGGSPPILKKDINKKEIVKPAPVRNVNEKALKDEDLIKKWIEDRNQNQQKIQQVQDSLEIQQVQDSLENVSQQSQINLDMNNIKTPINLSKKDITYQDETSNNLDKLETLNQTSNSYLSSLSNMPSTKPLIDREMGREL